MFWGAHSEALEVRAEGAEIHLRARFPYGREAVLRPATRAGKALAEVFAPGAFRASLQGGRDIFLLAGHDMAKPLASRSAGTLTLTDSDQALGIEARISPAMAGVTHAADFVTMLRAGLVTGLSPGFRVAEGGEKISQRADAVLRTVTQADLVELSAVTMPAYPEAQIEARSWKPDQGLDNLADAGLRRSLARWRA